MLDNKGTEDLQEIHLVPAQIKENLKYEPFIQENAKQNFGKRTFSSFTLWEPQLTAFNDAKLFCLIQWPQSLV